MIVFNFNHSQGLLEAPYLKTLKHLAVSLFYSNIARNLQTLQISKYYHIVVYLLR